jgi:hypothetical protein
MLINSTVSGNFTQGDAADGGGIEADGALTLINSTVSGNATHGVNADGGGIQSFGPLELDNSTVSGNSAAHFGGGIDGVDNSGPVTLRSSIVAGNSDSAGIPDLTGGGRGGLTVANSLIGNNEGTDLTATGPTARDASGNIIGSAASPVDPMLGPLQDNGGPTQTLYLLPGSPALGNGSNPLHLATDQRGLPRVSGGVVDMGAYEFQRGSILLPGPSGPPPQPQPAPFPPPGTHPQPAGLALISRRVGKARKLAVQVPSSKGGQPRLIVSPFQKPLYQSITAALVDLNGDGIFDAVVFTARRGKRRVSRTVRL